VVRLHPIRYPAAIPRQRASSARSLMHESSALQRLSMLVLCAIMPFVHRCFGPAYESLASNLMWSIRGDVIQAVVFLYLNAVSDDLSIDGSRDSREGDLGAMP
jgi:hypothetical protein